LSQRNEERLGALQQEGGSIAPVVEQQKQESGFNFVTPTEFVELPSKGLFYPEGHPLCGVEEIEIRYMTAADEDILTSKTLLIKGVAVDRLLQNIIVDKRIKVEDLLVGDKNALIVAARITGYGSDYVTNIKCSACGKTFEHTFNLEEIKSQTMLENEYPPGVERTSKSTFFVRLPKMNVRVEVKLLNGNDEKSLTIMKEKRKKHKLPEANLTDLFRLIIVGVEGYEDKSIVEQLIKNMPALDSNFLKTVYKKIVPNVDLKKEVICEVCDNVQELEMPFDANFFWPGS